jgi:hypothetical protein
MLAFVKAVIEPTLLGAADAVVAACRAAIVGIVAATWQPLRFGVAKGRFTVDSNGGRWLVP